MEMTQGPLTEPPSRYFYTSLIVLAMSSHRGSTLFNGFLHRLPYALPSPSLSKPICRHYDPSKRPPQDPHEKIPHVSMKALKFLCVLNVCSWPFVLHVSWLAS